MQCDDLTYQIFPVMGSNPKGMHEHVSGKKNITTILVQSVTNQFYFLLKNNTEWRKLASAVSHPLLNSKTYDITHASFLKDSNKGVRKEGKLRARGGEGGFCPNISHGVYRKQPDAVNHMYKQKNGLPYLSNEKVKRWGWEQVEHAHCHCQWHSAVLV